MSEIYLKLLSKHDGLLLIT